MTEWADFHVDTEFPPQDAVRQVLRNLVAGAGMRFSPDKPVVTSLPGGLSGSLVLMVSSGDRRIVVKIDRKARVDEESQNTKWFAKVIGSDLASPGDPIQPEYDGHWGGFTLYHAADYAGESTAEPLADLVRGWDRSAEVAGHVGYIFDQLNRRFFAGRWHAAESPDHNWLQGKLFPLVSGSAGNYTTVGRGTDRGKLWRQAHDFDRDARPMPFSFKHHPVDRWELSADGRHLTGWHTGDSAVESIELELTDPIPADRQVELLDREPRPIFLSGTVTDSKSHRYQRILNQHKMPNIATELPVRTERQFSCRGVLHGDLHTGNVLLIRNKRGEVVGRKIIDLAKAAKEDAPGPLWWDYVKMEVSLRRSLVADGKASPEVVSALSALVDLPSAAMSAIDLPESLLIAHWNAAFPQWPDAPMPFLRLRAKAWELFCAKFNNFSTRQHDHDKWLADYQTCLCYAALCFLKYGEETEAVPSSYCHLASRAWSGIRSGRWYDYPALGGALAAPIALTVLSEILRHKDSPAARHAGFAALSSLYELNSSVVANVLALEEPPHPVYRPPRLDGLSAADLELVHKARMRLRAQEDCLGRYRSRTRIDLSDLEQTFAYLRGSYDIPLKARPRQTEIATFDVLSLVRGLPECVILGQPGSGKTTFSDFRKLTSSGQGEALPVAIVVTFSAWSHAVIAAPDTGREDVFLDLVAEQLAVASRPEEVGRALARSLCEAGTFLLIFDGLNELDQHDRPPFVAAVKNLHRQFPGNQMQVTSRTLHYNNEFSAWPTIVLEDLSENEARTYIRQTMAQLARAKGEPPRMRDEHLLNADQLIGRLFGDQAPLSVRDLARTPMFLRFVVGIFAQAGKLPESRGSLLAAVSDSYYDRYKQSRTSRVPPMSPLPKDIMETALSHLAYSALDTGSVAAGERRHEPLTSLSGERAISVLTPNLPGGYDASMVWTELLETPLLHSVPGGGVANFEHQAFVEFYASLHLAQVLQTDPARFVRRAELRVWQETLQTLVGYQTEQTKDAVQEFLRLTPDLHLDLVVGCLLSAEHIEPEVLATVVDRLKQTLNDRDEPMPQRAAAAEALLALARLSDSEDVVTALLANLAGPDVCADVVRILISHQAHVSPRQRQELFSHVERLLITGEEAVVQACVEVLGQDDSALAGAVTLAPITRPSSVSALARRALVRRLADEYRLPWATLRKLGKDADPGVRFAALSALARVGQSAGDTAGSALAATVESDPGLFPELAGLMTELPPGFFAPDAERWTRLALEHCNRAGADNNALADLAEVVILKASQATQGARLLSQLPHATAARLSLRFWLDVIALSEIDVGTRAEVVRLVVRSLPSRWPPPDSKLMHELLSAISGNQQLETSTALADLVSGAAPEPLWSEYRNQVPPPSGPRLTADRAAGAIDRLQSASADVALRAWLDLCRPLPDRILIDLARDVDLSHRSALRRISLLGYHSVGSNLPHEALFELHQRLVTTSRPGPLIAAHADHFGARAIRYGFDVLAKQGYFARNPAARLALFRPALRQLPPRADSFSHFIAQSIAQSQIGVIKATIGDSDDRDLPICAASSPRIRYRAVPASPTACSAGT